MNQIKTKSTNHKMKEKDRRKQNQNVYMNNGKKRATKCDCRYNNKC